MPELTVDLGLTEEQMAELIHAAILEKIGPEQRDKIIGEALTFLITPKTQYDPLRGPEKQISPLMYAFQAAMNRAMQSAVEELLIEKDRKSVV